MRYFKLPVLVLICLIQGNAFAQHNLGIATSNYSAINSLYLNPANIAGGHEKVVVSLFSINLGIDNNLGTFSKLSNLGGNSSPFTFSDGKTFSALIPAADMKLPGVMVCLNDKFKQSFALTTRVRGINQFNNFSQDLYSAVKDNNRTSAQDYHFQTQNFNWTAHVWSELALSYALVAWEEGPHQLKAGITLRYLGGIDYLSLKGKNLDIDFKAGSDSFYASHSDLEFASNAVSSNNAYANGIDASGVLSQFFGSKAGGGFGMDVGVSYTYKIGGTTNTTTEDDGTTTTSTAGEHLLRASAAITDIGGIKYKQGNNYVVNVTGNGYITGSGLSDHLKSYTDLRNYAVSQGYSVDTGSKATKVYMPTAFNINVDYQIWNRFYVNALYLANMANRQHYGNSYYNQFSITPRYDSRLISVGLPITFSGLAHDMKMGLGFRVSGFYFGSDDMLALFSSNQHGFDFYFGAYVPIYRKTKRVQS